MSQVVVRVSWVEGTEDFPLFGNEVLRVPFAGNVWNAYQTALELVVSNVCKVDNAWEVVPEKTWGGPGLLAAVSMLRGEEAVRVDYAWAVESA